MTLQERLVDAHQRAARLYLRRQEVESQRHQLTQQAQALDVALVKTDGEIETLQSLLVEEASRGV